MHAQISTVNIVGTIIRILSWWRTNVVIVVNVKWKILKDFSAYRKEIGMANNRRHASVMMTQANKWGCEFFLFQVVVPLLFYRKRFLNENMRNVSQKPWTSNRPISQYQFFCSISKFQYWVFSHLLKYKVGVIYFFSYVCTRQRTKYDCILILLRLLFTL